MRDEQKHQEYQHSKEVLQGSIKGIQEDQVNQDTDGENRGARVEQVVEGQSISGNHIKSGLPAKPIIGNERIILLDCLRGFALLGILIINIVGFALPIIYSESMKISLAETWYDQFAENFAAYFVQGKFYTLFSLLFGVGFVIFIEKAFARSAYPRFLFVRRITVLLLFGITNAFLLWWGDILITYALCGFFLLFFVRAKPISLFIWAGALLLTMSALLLPLVQEPLENNLEQIESIQQFMDENQAMLEQSEVVYATGTFSEIMAQRFKDWLMLFSNILISPFLFLPIFLIGVAIFRLGLMNRLMNDRRFLHRAFWLSLSVGITLSLLKEWIKSQTIGGLFTYYDFAHLYVGFFADLGLSFTYALVIIYFLVQGLFKTAIHKLQWAGRMALTNYLMQAVVCNIIFYPFGLGLYGQFGLLALIAMAIPIFIIQVILSELWFKRFTFGPAEWLWRWLTYGKL